MSENNDPTEVDTGTQGEATGATGSPSHLDILKQRARLMGINFSNNIGIDALRARIEAKMSGEKQPDGDAADQSGNDEQKLNPLDGDVAGQPKMSRRQKLIRDATKLVRCRITCLDPKKKDLPGEIFTVGNRFIGTIRKFIPFGEVTDNGYHIPYVLYQELESRRFLNIRTSKDRATGQTKVETNWAKEFAIEVLPQLTKEELARLANAQAAAGSVE